MTSSPDTGSSVPPDDAAGDDLLAERGASRLAAAADQLRARPVRRAVEIADEVLSTSLRAPRRAVLVRVAAPYDFVRVSSAVLTEVLRRTLDEGLEGAAVGRVLLDVDRAEHLHGLTIELLVQFGTDILVLGDAARALADAALTSSIGRSADSDALVVRLAHVHVSDVTRGDPHLVDPDDEDLG